ncbi:hypothetical protein, partial [Desulfobacter sp.]|uniref:hypothetical protein n=1 Tax=Desulfobacter sp. TaxID=2294 RepID=UPI003D1335C6
NLKQALQKAAENYWTATVEAYGKEFKNAEDMVKAGTLKESKVSAQAIKKHKEIAYKLWDEVAKRDEASAAAIKMIKEWRGVK